jgi:hypothetical protein
LPGSQAFYIYSDRAKQFVDGLLRLFGATALWMVEGNQLWVED